MADTPPKEALTREQFDALKRVFFTEDATNADIAAAHDAITNMGTGTMTLDELADAIKAEETARQKNA